MAGNTSMINSAASGAYTNSSMDAYGLDMSDFLSLMVAQFTNQGMDATADIGDMLNQLVQMQMVTALASMSTAMNTMTDASIMTYAASLVGKEVTVAGYDEAGNYQEMIGEVTATGSYGGEQVIFMGEDMYYMTQIIAVGRLPSTEKGDTPAPEDQNSENTDPADKGEN
jgi:flagellar basal-body rod modification protein FlgD